MPGKCLLTFKTSLFNETVIARTLRSPHILEQSGVGRREILDNIGIPVKIDLSGVGENVQEHISARVTWGTRYLQHEESVIIYFTVQS